MIEITTKRLLIKPIELTEAPEVAALITKDISYWTAQPPWPYKLSDAKNWLISSQPWQRLGLYLEGKLIGTIKMPLSDDDEIGFIISENHRNLGYMTEAANAVIDYAFDNFGLSFISSSAHPENAASIKVHEKLGFKRLKETTHFWPNKGKDMPVVLFRLFK